MFASAPQELPEGEWFCGEDCKHIHSILSLLVANGPEPLADSIISRVLESRQLRATAADEQAASSKPHFEWQLLHGRQGDPANGRTLAEAVDIFSVQHFLTPLNRNPLLFSLSIGVLWLECKRDL